MLKYRILTTVILFPFVIWMVWIESNWIFSLLMAGIFGIAAWELADLVGMESFRLKMAYMVVILSGFIISAFVPAIPLLVVAFGTWLWATAVIIYYNKRGDPILGLESSLFKKIVSTIMIIFAWKGGVVLHCAAEGPIRLWLLLVIWASDTGGYFGGRWWGKNSRPFALRISPKKTWVGFWSSFIFGVSIAVFASLFLPLSILERSFLIGVMIISILVSTIGDLFESFLKRQAGVKDSGHFLPGHGGLLDRLDSLIAALPIFALGVAIFYSH